jgi:hypothetical protein
MASSGLTPFSIQDSRITRAMSFRTLSNKYLEPGSMWLMVLGIVALCQPWIQVLHAYGVTITLVGLIGFSVFSKIKPMPEDE